MPCLSSAPEIVRRYFGLAAQPDSEAYFALFAEDATVEDEGTELHGLAAIREWRASVPLVQYTITDVEQTPNALVVTITIAGDFPGSPFAGLEIPLRGLRRSPPASPAHPTLNQ